MALGIDIYARYQTVTNWSAVKAAGVGYTWVKLTDGGGRAASPGDALVAGAKAAGIPVGGYHYAQSSPTPEAQADILINEVERLGAKGLVPMLDLEAPFSPNAAARDFGTRFVRRVAARGYRPGVYMSDSFARTLRPDQWGISNLVIWIARYGSKPAYGGRYDVHQYSSTGRINGISASGVDLNESYTNNHIVSGPLAPTNPGSGSSNNLPILYGDDNMILVPKGGAENAPTNFPIPVSMLREHDLVIAPGDAPVVLYAIYNWDWDAPGVGGNPIEPGKPRVIPVQGSYSAIIPKGTGKADVAYWSDDDFTIGIFPR